MEGEKTLELINIQKYFGSHQVLKGINLSASKGDVISILGSSGSGKSTLLRCTNLLEVPDGGDIFFHGEKIELTRKNKESTVANNKQLLRVRSKLAMVFQQFNLWSHLNVLENVMEAQIRVLKIAKAEAKKTAEYYLDKVGILEKRTAYPANLSGGQQQRVGIARALAMEPEILLFDEPTSALDPELVGEVLQVMRKLATEGRTMLVVTHEMNFAKEVSNYVLFLHQGVIEAQGASNSIFENPSSERFYQFLTAFKK